MDNEEKFWFGWCIILGSALILWALFLPKNPSTNNSYGVERIYKDTAYIENSIPYTNHTHEVNITKK